MNGNTDMKGFNPFCPTGNRISKPEKNIHPISSDISLHLLFFF